MTKQSGLPFPGRWRVPAPKEEFRCLVHMCGQDDAAVLEDVSVGRKVWTSMLRPPDK